MCFLYLWYSNIYMHKESKNVPANLMRPKSPKSGKKILLEYIPFIWKKIKFF